MRGLAVIGRARGASGSRRRLLGLQSAGQASAPGLASVADRGELLATAPSWKLLAAEEDTGVYVPVTQAGRLVFFLQSNAPAEEE
eukprot:CAMPEP_0197660616 /NCGR_PEP_ID=MMETSP1338-20131121/50954_1 /TAXON_ID=43686 ORGANISM="Pelagodinium beii, Strain RCC1491" /NCGR_SAMPLE_ID=MMETSP1338 /ASSEMBLY_ACC=CAM_ASM_000754 /LENGTH=84 /DNA_ID=CAMNT_0043237999 /DNA_START=54 /DNA_END=308 /DNA_ORIENTATION=-